MRVERRRKVLARMLTVLLALVAAACGQTVSSGPSPSPQPGPTGPTYYVDNCVVVGDDGNNGMSPSTPWLTINKVNRSTFNPGDFILFERTCTWRDQLTVPSSGSAGSPITFGAYGTGAPPILSGADLLTSWASEAPWYYASPAAQPNQVFRDNQRPTLAASKAALATGQWWWDSTNLRVYVYDNPSGHTVEASQRMMELDIGDAGGSAGISYVTVNDIEAKMANDGYGNVQLLQAGTSHIIIHNVTSDYSNNDGIKIDPGVKGGDIVIEDCLVYRNVTGINFLLNSGASSGHQDYVQNNRVYLNAADGIDTGNYIIVQNNEVYENGASDLSGIGIHVFSDVAGDHTYGQNNIVRYNLIFDTTLNPMQPGERDHSGIETDVGAGYNEIYGNVIYGNQGPCLDIHNSNNEEIFNNTCYGNTLNASFPGGPTEIYLTQETLSSTSTNNTFENNIAYATGTNYAIYVDSGSASNPQTVVNNLLYAPGSTNWYYWGSAGGNSLSTFNSLTGASNNSYSNPLYASTSGARFWLQSGSPAIDAGTNLGSPYNFALLPSSVWANSVLTGNQNSYGTGWEIGAYIFTGQTVQGVLSGGPIVGGLATDRRALCALTIEFKARQIAIGAKMREPR